MKSMDTIRTKNTIKQIYIEEFYNKEENGDVFWNYRFEGGVWHKELSPFREIPFVILKPFDTIT